MSQKKDKRRIAFLNDLCAKCGILSTDPRRGQAGNVYVAYGEEKCRDWLAQAAGDYAKWEAIVDIKHARMIVSKQQKPKKKTRRARRRLANLQQKNKHTGDSQCKARQGNICGTVRPDGSGSGWRNLSRNQEYSLANRL